MKPKYCLYLNNGINFHYSGLTFCNKLWIGDMFQPYDKGYLEYFLEKRKDVIDNMQNGIAPDNCKNCLYLKEIENSNENNKIKYIEIYHWNHCNCACFYCSNRETTKLKITEKKQKGVIDVLPNLKKLHKLDMLDKNINISLVGGEPVLLKEFTGLLKFFIKNNYSVSILSNGILYEKYIPKAIRSNENSYLNISLDCGSKELFKKIKGVDKFDDVIKNIKRYINESKEAKNRIMLKYILLKGVNDNKEEIDKWINLCSNLGVTNYFPSIEFCHSVRNPENNELTEEICNLYEYMKQKIKQTNPDFTISTYDFVEELINKHSYKIR